MDVLSSTSSGLLGVSVNSTVSFNGPLNRLCIKVGHVSGLPNRVLVDVTSYRYPLVEGSERYKEIHRNREQSTTWTCLVPIEPAPCPGQIRVVGTPDDRRGSRRRTGMGERFVRVDGSVSRTVVSGNVEKTVVSGRWVVSRKRPPWGDLE